MFKTLSKLLDKSHQRMNEIGDKSFKQVEEANKAHQQMKAEHQRLANKYQG